ncbi:MAG TPA: tetratricopeptide repeat protein [Candidatus Angelobacter sp.]|nr:tetratricopeptide repeat protein [Candidatus Angelobacter sp.]
MNERFHNRLGVIRAKQGLPQLAIDHFKRAIELDPDQFSPANSLAAAYLEIDEWEQAELLLPGLEKKARTPSNFALLAHTKARVAYSKGDLAKSKELLKGEIAASQNVIPNLSVLIRVQCALFDYNYSTFPAIASVELKEAENALKRIVELDPSNEFLDTLERAIAERQLKQKPIRRH